MIIGHGVYEADFVNSEKAKAISMKNRDIIAVIKKCSNKRMYKKSNRGHKPGQPLSK
jgi:hypothetical protein